MLLPAPPSTARVGLALVAAMLAGCTIESQPTVDRFGATGRMIALSGAGAGARHACVVCHGLTGEGNGAGTPRLAGLDPGYLDRQLEAYADGRRSDPTMSWISRQLSGPERLAVSHYFAAMPFRAPGDIVPPPPPIYARGDPERGIPACAICHGVAGQGLGPAVPPLAGQPPAYLAEQIERWRRSERRSDPGNIMLGISQRLTDREVAVLVAYAARLPGVYRHPEPSAASR